LADADKKISGRPTTKLLKIITSTRCLKKANQTKQHFEIFNCDAFFYNILSLKP